MTERYKFDRAPIIGRCEKCGRRFCTLPIDGIDHYGDCGGKVKDLTPGDGGKDAS